VSNRMKVVAIAGAMVVATLSLLSAHAAPKNKTSNTIEISVTEKGFEPGNVKVKKGEPVVLVITRKTDATCAKQVVVADYGIKKDLPLNKPVSLTLVPKATGEIKYGCGMNMLTGVLTVE
jgi:plastocyanin domain-containing protein